MPIAAGGMAALKAHHKMKQATSGGLSNIFYLGENKMISKKLGSQSWEEVWERMKARSVQLPLSLQYDYKMTVDGDIAVLRLQMDNHRNLTILQVVYTRCGNGRAESVLIGDGALLTAFLTLAVEQCSAAFGPIRKSGKPSRGLPAFP